MGQLDVVAIRDVRCPSCEADALYWYGRIKTGGQRFMCLMCGTQFTPGAKKSSVPGKPLCPKCGKTMNVYKLEGNIIRFRCSGYPECKTFRKFTMREEKYIHAAAEKTGRVIGKAALGMALEKAFEGSTLSLLAILI